jgi:hypothetical protein
LGVGLTTPPRGKKIYVQKTSEMPRTGLINRRRLVCKEKEWRSKVANRDEWWRIMREAKAQKGL